MTSEPLLIVEVLSPDSRDRDLRVKAAEYTALGSLEAYIVAEQDKPVCYVWVRDTMRNFPEKPHEISGKDGVITVPALGLAIRLGDIYRDHFRSPA